MLDDQSELDDRFEKSLVEVMARDGIPALEHRLDEPNDWMPTRFVLITEFTNMETGDTIVARFHTRRMASWMVDGLLVAGGDVDGCDHG